LSFELKPKSSLALIGKSGCGKSTILNLLLRFYEANGGIITIDGIDIRDFDIRYLRSKIGVVGQEPLLINGSIR
jgi:ATP-binding cassette subfamily B (MDR/TAP) protein 1